MKAAQVLIGWVIASLVNGPTLRAQTSAAPPPTQFGPSSEATVRDPVFSAPFLRPDEVDSPPQPDPALATDAQNRVHVLMNSRADLCVAGLYAVHIAFIVDASGRPTEIQWTLTNNLAYASIEMAAIAFYRFAPATLNGRPVPCLRTVGFKENRPFSVVPMPLVPAAPAAGT